MKQKYEPYTKYVSHAVMFVKKYLNLRYCYSEEEAFESFSSLQFIYT